MVPFSKILLAISAVWAVAALLAQARAARGALQDAHAPAAGKASRGILYGFTGAMIPARKESASRNPVSFSAGLLLHLGVAAAFLTVIVSTFLPAPSPRVLGAPLAAGAGIGLAAGAFLLVKRIATADLRAISFPDDYVASLAIAAFLGGSLAFWAGALPATALRIVAALLLLYLPLGKLRHAVFFFLARADLSARLGLRGVYPPEGGGRAGRG